MARSLGRLRPRETAAFTPEEKRIIAEWSVSVLRKGLATEFERHDVPCEVLVVSGSAGDEPMWLVHKTPDGRIAVRQWPGLAEIVIGLPDALASIASAFEQGDG